MGWGKTNADKISVRKCDVGAVTKVHDAARREGGGGVKNNRLCRPGLGRRGEVRGEGEESNDIPSPQVRIPPPSEKGYERGKHGRGKRRRVKVQPTRRDCREDKLIKGVDGRERFPGKAQVKQKGGKRKAIGGIKSLLSDACVEAS